MKFLNTWYLAVSSHVITLRTMHFFSPRVATCPLKSPWVDYVLDPFHISIYISFSLVVKVHRSPSKCTTENKLICNPGPSQKRFPSTLSSLLGSQPSMELSGPVVTISLKKKRGSQKGVIKGTTPDSEVWHMNDDEIIGITFCLFDAPRVLTSL